jgi:hypothetical protein
MKHRKSIKTNKGKYYAKRQRINKTQHGSIKTK